MADDSAPEHGGSAQAEPPRKRKRGPKPKDPADRRDHSVTARLTDAEIRDLDRRRGRMARGEYLRRAALNRLPPQVPPINREAWVALARTAANLNQLARHANEQGAADADDVRAIVQQLRAALIGFDYAEDDDQEARR